MRHRDEEYDHRAVMRSAKGMSTFCLVLFPATIVITLVQGYSTFDEEFNLCTSMLVAWTMTFFARRQFVRMLAGKHRLHPPKPGLLDRINSLGEQ